MKKQDVLNQVMANMPLQRRINLLDVEYAFNEGYEFAKKELGLKEK